MVVEFDSYLPLDPCGRSGRSSEGLSVSREPLTSRPIGFGLGQILTMRGKSESEVAGSSERLTSALMVIGLRLPTPKSSQVYRVEEATESACRSGRGCVSKVSYLFILEPNDRSVDYHKRMSRKYGLVFDSLDQVLRVVDDLVSFVSASSEQFGQSCGHTN